MSEQTETTELKLELIPVKQIEIRENVRKEINPKDLKELKDSIIQQGLLQPILVRSVNSHYELIAGQRRFLAFKEAYGEDERIPANIREISDDEIELLQLTENDQRTDMNPFELGEAYEKVRNSMSAGIKDIARLMGKTPQYVAERIQLLKLYKPIRKSVLAGKVSLTMALELSKYPQEAQKSAFEQYTNDGYMNNVKEVISFIDRYYLCQLGNAIFPLDQKVGIRNPCAECQSRSSAAEFLFGKEMTAKNDRCLNKECFEYKTKCQVEVKYNELLSEHKEKAIAVGHLHWDEKVREDKVFGKIHESNDFVKFDSLPKAKQAKYKDQMLYAIIVLGANKGETLTVIKEKELKKDNTPSSESKPKQTPDERYFRKVDLNVIFPSFVKKLTLAVKRAFEMKLFGSDAGSIPVFLILKETLKSFDNKTLHKILYPDDTSFHHDKLTEYTEKVIKEKDESSASSLISLMALLNGRSLDKEMCYSYCQEVYKVIKNSIDISDIEAEVDNEFKPIGEDLLAKFRKKNERNPKKK